MSYIQFQLRRGLASEWYSANPALADGEIGLETDTRLYKIGDGTTRWRLLSYGTLAGSTPSIVNITTSTASTSTTTGALVVNGGVGIGGNLNVSGNIYSRGSLVGTSSTYATNIYGGSTGSLVIQSGNNSTTFVPIGNFGTVLYSDGSTATWVASGSISSTTATNSQNVYIQQTNESRISSGTFYLTMSELFDDFSPLNVVSTVSWDDTLNRLSSPNIKVSGTTVATTTNTGALQIVGGVGIGKGLYVGGTITATNMTLNGYQVSTSSALTIQLSGASQGNASTINFSTGTTVSVVTGVATVQSVDTLQLVTNRGASSSNAISITNATQSTNSSTGALTVSGGVGIGGALYVGGTLQVSAATTFGGPVTFSGTATYILSTNTFYTDNLIELHTPPSGVTGQWASDDGKDIGLRFHYYNRAASTDSNAALILADDSQYLEWYNTGAESNTGTFTGANYGTFKTGSIILTNTTASNSTTTGALTVVGGAGIGGNLYIGGTTTVAGGVNFSTTGTLTSPKLQSYKETVNTIGTVTVNTNIDVSTANIFDVTLGGSPITFTFTNPPSSGTAQPVTVILRQDATGNRLATFTNAKYTDGNLPVLSTGSNQVDVLTFFTVNGGSFWFGTFAMANVS
jgi:Major tropism determinant N-terminal domain